MSTTIQIGFYGKLPCRGDFLQRRAPPVFVDVWDEWLQAGLQASREQLGDAWLDRYLTGSVWRFVLAPGVCDGGVYAGILVPSVDRVGRYFPLTIVTQLHERCCPLDIACSARAWFDAAEALVLDALAAEALDLDRFDEQVEQLRELLVCSGVCEPSSLGGALDDSTFPLQSPLWHAPIESAASFQRAANAFAYRELRRALAPLALWWTDGSSALGASWLSTRGLPETSAFTAMLSGDWTGSNWASVGADANAGHAAMETLLQ